MPKNEVFHTLIDQFLDIFVRNVLLVHLRIFRLTLVDFSGPTGIFIPFPWSQRGCGSRSHENWASKLRAFYLKKQSWNSTRHKLPRTASDHQIFLRINFVNFTGYKSCLTRLKWLLVSHCHTKKWSAKTLQMCGTEMIFRVHLYKCRCHLFFFHVYYVVVIFCIKCRLLLICSFSWNPLFLVFCYCCYQDSAEVFVRVSAQSIAGEELRQLRQGSHACLM